MAIIYHSRSLVLQSMYHGAPNHTCLSNSLLWKAARIGNSNSDRPACLSTACFIDRLVSSLHILLNGCESLYCWVMEWRWKKLTDSRGPTTILSRLQRRVTAKHPPSNQSHLIYGPPLEPDLYASIIASTLRPPTEKIIPRPLSEFSRHARARIW